MESAQGTNVAQSRSLQIGAGRLRVAVKECIGMAGIATRCGSAIYENNPPEAKNAASVEAVLSADCTIIGTANMHELAFGVTGINHYLGTPVNPAWPNRIPGGSSSGSASLVASDQCDFALGTDTGGSIRLPACCCGVFGMKPTFGRIDRRGAVPSESTLDCIGPIAGSAEMLTLAMRCLDPGFRIGLRAGPFTLRRVTVEADVEVATAIEAAIGGLTIDAVELAHLRAAYEAALIVINAEAVSAFGSAAHGDNGLDATVRERILAAERNFSQAAVVDAEAMRSTFRAEVDAALEGVDALVLPTMPVVPPTLEQAGDMQALMSLTALVRPFNLSGHPAITLPIRTAESLPAGVQLIGRLGEDELLCAVAEWLAPLITAKRPTLEKRQ